MFKHFYPASRPLSIISFTLLLLLTATRLFGSEPEWDESHKSWLLALTYADGQPDDFGKETGAYERELLEKFKPRVVVSPKGLVPVDFYDFYLPHTVVKDESRGGEVVKEAPSREYLKRIERERRYYLDFRGPFSPCGSECDAYIGAGYGRHYVEKALFTTEEGEKELPVVILKYTFPFTYSGLPARFGYVRASLMSMAVDLERFHELDIHGAVHIVLNRQGRPIILLLAQHNHFRSYIIGKDVAWPEDDHLPVCFAERSNEPYPCPAGTSPHYYRTVGNPKDTGYVIDGKGVVLTAGEDKVYGLQGGGKQVSYRLRFLPDRDPLYVSWIPLGDRQRILGFDTFYRKGPPGIDLNTWPELKEYGKIMQFWYWRDDSTDDGSLMRDSFRSFTDVDFKTVLKRNGTRLYRDLKAMGYTE